MDSETPALSGTLVNCTGEDIHVLVGDIPRLLPAAYPPVLLHSVGEQTDAALTVPGRNGRRDPINVDLWRTSPNLGILHDLPAEPGVVFLVDADVLEDFPFRDDFVTPALYRYLPRADASADSQRTDKTTRKGKKAKHGKHGKHRKHAGKKPGRKHRREHGMTVLIGVTRAFPEPATPATEMLRLAGSRPEVEIPAAGES
jgi:hypothetical protein